MGDCEWTRNRKAVTVQPVTAFAIAVQKTTLPMYLYAQRTADPALVVALAAADAGCQCRAVIEVVEARSAPLQRIPVTIAITHGVVCARRCAETDGHRIVEVIELVRPERVQFSGKWTGCRPVNQAPPKRDCTLLRFCSSTSRFRLPAPVSRNSSTWISAMDSPATGCHVSAPAPMS